MASTNTSLHSFNRGLISPLALAREDIERVSLSATTFDNFMPRNLGAMMLRPGGAYIGATLSNAAAKYIPFIFATDDTALCEVTGTSMRVWISDTLVTRASVSSAVSNSAFTSDLTSWTDDDDAGGASTWNSSGYMQLQGDGTNFAKRYQEITVAGGDQSVEHALDIVIERGPVILRVGSTQGDDDYISETTLDSGTHSLALTPTGNFFIEFRSSLKRHVLVDSCAVASSGVMSVTAPWAAGDISKLRYTQSGDIIFIAADGYQQYKIERRATNSWSVVKYETYDGPFLPINISPITMTPTALSGSIQITASEPYFKSTNVGGLLRLQSTGQKVTSSIAAEDTFTNAIKVNGVDADRIFTIIRSGDWSATITLQRSLTSSTGPWEDVTTYTTNATITYDDTLDNQIAWYQIGVKTGGFTTSTISGATQANPCVITDTGHPYVVGEDVTVSGVSGMTELNGNTYTITAANTNDYTFGALDSTAFTAYSSGGVSTSAGPAVLTLDYALGSIEGTAIITQYNSSTVVLAQVVVDLGKTDATDDWYEGEWSSRRGYPSAVALAEGRLAWAGKNKVWASASDAFTTFYDLGEGDAESFSKTIGAGPVDKINWMVPALRLLVGAQGAEFEVRASSDDEPLTPTNANIKPFSTQGSANSVAVKLDDTAIYVQRGGSRLMESSMNERYRFQSLDLSTFYPDAGDSQITHIAVQRQPDTRIHCLRTDGDVSILLHDKAEGVSCWVKYSCAGTVEDIIVLPGADGTGEDSVYYLINRTIESSTVRYLEKWSLESQCQGGTISRQLDSHVTGTQSSSTTVSGLTHLEGETVHLWGDGVDLGTYTVSSGAITASTAVVSYCVGLPYTAQWESSKLAVVSNEGTALCQKKKVNQIGFILKNTHYQGLQFGPNFTDLDEMPSVKNGTAVAADTIYTAYDEESSPFPGQWDTDSRICLQAASPRPCTVLAAVISMETTRKY